MSTLYILGNGFDLHHKLKTSLRDFKDFRDANNLSYAEVERFFDSLDDSKEFWVDFEDDLGLFSPSAFFEEVDINCVSIADPEFRFRDIYGLEDELKERSEFIVDRIRDVFTDWVNSISLKPSIQLTCFQHADRFLTFNYTSTLESVYQIPENHICHLHGATHLGSKLIFGHGKSKPNEKVDSIFDDANDNAEIVFNALRKPVAEVRQRHKHFLSQTGFKEIVVFGHSLSDVDLPYFEDVCKANPNTQWKISLFNKAEKGKFSTQLKKAGIQCKNITFFKPSFEK